jgi:hypothetical protein
MSRGCHYPCTVPVKAVKRPGSTAQEDFHARCQLDAVDSVNSTRQDFESQSSGPDRLTTRSQRVVVGDSELLPAPYLTRKLPVYGCC